MVWFTGVVSGCNFGFLRVVEGGQWFASLSSGVCNGGTAEWFVL